MTSNPARGWEYENNALKILENPSERSTNFKIFWGSIPFRMLPRNLPNAPPEPSECYPGTFRIPPLGPFRMLPRNLPNATPGTFRIQPLGPFRMLARRYNHWALRIRVPSIFYIYIYILIYTQTKNPISNLVMYLILIYRPWLTMLLYNAIYCTMLKFWPWLIHHLYLSIPFHSVPFSQFLPMLGVRGTSRSPC